MIETLAGIGGTILGVAAVFLAVYLIGRLVQRAKERKRKTNKPLSDKEDQ